MFHLSEKCADLWNRVQVLFDHLIQRDTYLAIPNHFLSNQSVSRIFSDILLAFLLGRVRDLGSCERSEATVILGLFKTVFSSVQTYAENEPILRPHVRAIVISCLKHAMSEKRPTNYYQLLRNLFRSVQQGKFDLVMKEFVALLKNLLDSLVKLFNAAQDDDTKEQVSIRDGHFGIVFGFASCFPK